MPDYYSVMLEIAKDRATAASMVTCSVEDFDAGRCPDEVSAGDRYLRRAVNEPCRKLVSRIRSLLSHEYSFLLYTKRLKFYDSIVSWVSVCLSSRMVLCVETAKWVVRPLINSLSSFCNPVIFIVPNCRTELYRTFCRLDAVNAGIQRLTDM